MHHYIITGTSSGIGAALAEQLIDRNHSIFCISRRENPELIAKAQQAHCDLQYHRFDLRHTDRIGTVVDMVFASMPKSSVESVSLINNAAVLSPIAPLGRLDPEELRDNLMINTVAPAVLTACWMRHVQHLQCRATVLFLSSGAAQHPYEGLCGYCSSKAALNMFASCAGLEQQRHRNPVMILAVAPGVVDTPMQDAMRASDVESLPSKPRFEALKAHGELVSASRVAQRLVALLKDTKLKTGSVVDIR
jgi:benzil reductase ((S)-benzoin forming)